DQLPRGLEEQLLKPPLFGNNPVVVESREPRTPIQIDRFSEALLAVQGAVGRGGGLKSPFELCHVCGHRLRVQANRGPVGDENGSSGQPRRLQLVAERGKRGAEAVASRVQIVTRPQKLDQHLARMGSLAVKSEIGEQRPCLAGAKTGDGSLPSPGT